MKRTSCLTDVFPHIHVWNNKKKGDVFLLCAALQLPFPSTSLQTRTRARSHDAATSTSSWTPVEWKTALLQIGMLNCSCLVRRGFGLWKIDSPHVRGQARATYNISVVRRKFCQYAHFWVMNKGVCNRDSPLNPISEIFVPKWTFLKKNPWSGADIWRSHGTNKLNT